MQNVKAQIAESQKIASGGGSEQDIAEAKIELEVCFVMNFVGSDWFWTNLCAIQVLESLQAVLK